MFLKNSDMQKLQQAIKEISSHKCSRVEIDRKLKVYAVPSGNPNKYTIRVDIKVEEE